MVTEYARLGRRAVAFCIDIVLAWLAGAAIESFIGGTAGSIAALTLPCLYFTLLESSSRRATLGKMLLKLGVTDLEGDRISFLRANARFWIKFVHLFSVIICTGWIKIFLEENVTYTTPGQAALWGAIKGIYPLLFLATLFAPIWMTKKKQAVHDLVAWTLVTSGRAIA